MASRPSVFSNAAAPYDLLSPREHQIFDELHTARATQGHQYRLHQRLLEERREGALPEIADLRDQVREALGQLGIVVISAPTVSMAAMAIAHST